MAPRTTSRTVTFTHPFHLKETGGIWPAGIYEVETDEEDLGILSFSARRRVAVIIHRSDPAHGRSEAVRVDARQIEAALQADAAMRLEDTEMTSAVAADGSGNLDTERIKGVRYFTPVWVVPLILGIAAALAAWFGPFDAPDRDSGKAFSVILKTLQVS